MFYKIGKKVMEADFSEYNQDELFAGYLSENDYLRNNELFFKFPKEVERQLSQRYESNMQISKIDAYPGYYIGEVSLLNRECLAYDQSITFLIRKNLFLVLFKQKDLQQHFCDLLLDHEDTIASLERLIFLFLNDFIMKDAMMVEQLQLTLTDIDEKVFHKQSMNFNHIMERPRKQIMLLDYTYDHLLEIAEELIDNELDFFDCETRYFKILQDRFNRLHTSANMLKEFVLSIRETHQSNVDNDLNSTMKLLTVLTAIFQPLTLIVGWYGMNFTNMPELTWKYGYLFVTLLSVASISICYIIFKKKKML